MQKISVHFGNLIEDLKNADLEFSLFLFDTSQIDLGGIIPKKERKRNH